MIKSGPQQEHKLKCGVLRQTFTWLLQRVPTASAEGAAQTGEANPGWQFRRNTEGNGLQMNPVFWQVTYHLRSNAGTMPITNTERRTAFQNVQRHLARNPSWRANRSIERIEIALRSDSSVTPSTAAQDLVTRASMRKYAFECFTAASLIQFVGVWRGLQQTSPATAETIFNQRYADFRVTHQEPTSILQMGGRRILTNIQQLGSFSLRMLLDDTSDKGLQRGDWVYLDNHSFITRGAFQGENATYLGNKRFYGHGIGIFNINEYIRRLQQRHRVRLNRDQILNQVVVSPYYRAPDISTSSSASPIRSP